MASYSEPYASLASVTITLNSLANGTYAAGSAIDLSSIDPLDVIYEVALTPGTVSGNKQAAVFLKGSFDGSDFSSGPESGTTTTDEPNLYFLGTLPLNTNSTIQRKQFSVKAALGFIPPHQKLIIKNDSGAALAGSGNSAEYTTLTGNSV